MLETEPEGIVKSLFLSHLLTCYLPLVSQVLRALMLIWESPAAAHPGARHPGIHPCVLWWQWFYLHASTLHFWIKETAIRNPHGWQRRWCMSCVGFPRKQTELGFVQEVCWRMPLGINTSEGWGPTTEQGEKLDCQAVEQRPLPTMWVRFTNVVWPWNGSVVLHWGFCSFICSIGVSFPKEGGVSLGVMAIVSQGQLKGLSSG